MGAPIVTTALLEREFELGGLARLVEESCAGRGRLLLIEGPPGIGKTRLLAAARALARERGMFVLSARASELDRDFPLGVLRQLFEPLLSSADAAERAHLLRGSASLAAPVFGDAPAGGAGRDPSLPHFHGLYWLIANLAEERPAALVIDDLQWADPGSLRFLQFLLPRVEELPVLLAFAARDSEPGLDRQAIDALATDPLAEVLRPAPLSETAVGELITSDLQETADREFCGACHQATGGNPFLVRELLREMAAEEVAPYAAHATLVRELTPPTVARAVLLRLGRLGDDAVALARAVAVLGDRADLHLACALADLTWDRGDEVAATLADAAILVAGRPLAFAHPMLRSAVYSDIEGGERARAHRRAAALLADEGADPEAIAVHLLATEPARDPQVVKTLQHASERALARGAGPTAVACLRRALEEPPPATQRGHVVLALAAAELHAGEPAAAAEHFDEGSRIVDDPRALAASAWDHAVALQSIGRHDEAYAVRERAVEEVAGIDPDLALLVEASLIASASLDSSRLAWARERLERHRGRLSVDTPAECRLLAMQVCLDALYGDQPAEALANTAERALVAGKLVDNRGLPTTPFFCAIEVLWLADRNGPARRALDRTVEDARRCGSVLGFACALGWRCRLLAREGALADAEADARSCAEVSLQHGAFTFAPPMLGYVLDVLIDRGQLDDAEQLLLWSGMAEREADHDVTFDPVLHARARLRAAAGDLPGARADLANVQRRHARWNSDPILVPAVLVAPELGVDDRDQARADAARMLREAQAWGTPRSIGIAQRAAALIDGGARGLELLHEAAAVLERSPARLEYGRALTDLGAALRRTNRRRQAREPLRRALDVADACGAGPLADRARQELRAAGGRPRRPRVTGASALTPSERRIARMAADGLSNPEIAQALFVTKKTVETHLGNAYRKLDIQSRAQLPAALPDER